MVSSTHIHAWRKGLKSCIALKWQVFQLFFNIMISTENVVKSYSAAWICPLRLPEQCQGPWQHAVIYLQLSGSCCPASGLGDRERQKGRANKYALPGVTQMTE